MSVSCNTSVLQREYRLSLVLCQRQESPGLRWVRLWLVLHQAPPALVGTLWHSGRLLWLHFPLHRAQYSVLPSAPSVVLYLESPLLWLISAVVCLFVGCLTSQQQASVSQGRICLDNFTCCHTEIEVADQTFYLTQSQYTDTRLTSPSADPITLDAWQDSHWSANF